MKMDLEHLSAKKKQTKYFVLKLLNAQNLYFMNSYLTNFFYLYRSDSHHSVTYRIVSILILEQSKERYFIL